jgi:hypothetical protein
MPARAVCCGGFPVPASWSVFAFFVASTLFAAGQSPANLVQQAVQTELTASANDHSRWLYYDVDRKPDETTAQWVAETGDGDLHRVMTEHGLPTSSDSQRSGMEKFIHDPTAQARQRKAGAHDDRESEDMLKLLPDAFTWTITGQKYGSTVLHFKPNDAFKPPSWEARVFAAMEGEMRVDNAQHRIVSLSGRLTRDVRFCGGLCGNLSAGGTFQIERREIGPSIWQITETHVHIHGTALFFKNISQEEDDVKTRFHPLPGNITFAQAEVDLLKQTG